MRGKRYPIATVLMLVLVLGFASAEAVSEVAAGEDRTGTYENTLFDSSYVHRIDIRIAKEDWNDLLANPLEKTKYKVDIEIDGEIVEEVSFATKGNSSLAFVAADGLSRYSFKVNFGKFNKDQTFRGLNKLNLNNIFYDTTYMKDYVSFEVFREAGAPAPLTSYVWLTINGKDQGLYLAVEDLSESFMERNYGGQGVIYKPESSELGLTIEKVEAVRANGLPMASDPHGSDLVYTDDNPDSYPDIFKNNETKAKKSDDQAVVAALKALSEGKDLESYLYTDEIIAYFAAHNFLLNFDSYTAGMLHNLVLYANNGKLSLLPWDYNLAFATFVPAITNEVMENATDILNQGIDSPLFYTDEESRPMWSWIANDEFYLSRYHDALDNLVSGYFESGRFESEAGAVYEMILPYVEKDPTLFYSLDEFRQGYSILIEFCKRRAQSVRRQLDGNLSTVSSEQLIHEKVDAADLDIMKMGGPDWVR